MDTGTMIAMVPVILLIMVMLYEKYKGRFYLHLLSKGKIELDPITKYVYNDLKDHPMRWKFSGDLVINVVNKLGDLSADFPIFFSYPFLHFKHAYMT